MRPLACTLPLAKTSSTGIACSFLATASVSSVPALHRLQILRHRRIGAGLDHVRHALGALEEALGEFAALVVAIPVIALGQHDALRRLKAEAMHLGEREQQAASRWPPGRCRTRPPASRSWRCRGRHWRGRRPWRRRTAPAAGRRRSRRVQRNAHGAQHLAAVALTISLVSFSSE